MRFGHYEILTKIARGGMAEVYLAKYFGSGGYERQVVIKKILPTYAENPSFINMLIDEARIVSTLNHRNIVQIFELGRFNNEYFIAMEYVNGKDLFNITCRTKALAREISVEQAIFIVGEVCQGLHYAHEKKDDQGEYLDIIHRDITPQNVLISFDGQVKIVDFGVAKAKTNVNVTQVGKIKGKISYMSPEQIFGKKLDRRSDIFSIGGLLYELLVGVPLIQEKSFDQIAKKLSKCDFTPLTALNKSLPEKLDALVFKALDKNPQKRYQTAQEFGNALTDFLILAKRNGTIAEYPSLKSLSQYILTLYDRQEPDKYISQKDLRQLDADDETWHRNSDDFQTIVSTFFSSTLTSKFEDKDEAPEPGKGEKVGPFFGDDDTVKVDFDPSPTADKLNFDTLKMVPYRPEGKTLTDDNITAFADTHKVNFQSSKDGPPSKGSGKFFESSIILDPPIPFIFRFLKKTSIQIGILLALFLLSIFIVIFILYPNVEELLRILFSQ